MLMRLKNQLKQGICLGLILLVLGIALSIAFNPYNDINVQTITVINKSQERIVGKLYTPKLGKLPLPVVILGHGINNSKQHSHLLAVEFARSGLAAIGFDFGGFGESYSLPKSKNVFEQLTVSTQEDTQAIFDYIQANPQQFDLDKIGIVGHSMGGNTALTFAQNHPNIKSTVSLSFGSEVNPDSPKNLLFALGLYEQLNPIRQLQEVFHSALPSPVKCDYMKICGDFSGGTARQFLISPTADHLIAPFDPYLIQKVILWTKKSLNITDLQIVSFKIHSFIIAQSLVFIGSLMLGLYWLDNKPLWCRSVGIVIICLWLLSHWGILASDWSSLAICFLLILSFLSNYARQNKHLFFKKIKLFVLYIGLGIITYFIIICFSNIEQIVSQPYDLVYLPKFFIQFIFFICYNFILKIRLILTPNYTLNLTVSWLFWIVLIIETLYPTKILNLLEFISISIINWLRQPFRLGLGKLSRQEGITLTLLGIFLIITIIIRLRDGLLTEAIEMGNIFIILLIKTILLPIFLIGLTIRSRWFHHLEASL